MIRQIIKIDKEKCNGCRLCVEACHEGAIEMVGGKASLLRDDYCDGLGNCLPVCPTGAITFESREAAPYNKEAQEKYLEDKKKNSNSHFVCPGSAIKNMKQNSFNNSNGEESYNLINWPIQLKLMPVNSPYLENSHLILAADCTAFAYPSFSKLVKEKIVAIACPKLDESYIEKLSIILKSNNIKKITILRMSVPCCGGITYQVNEAMKIAGKNIETDIIIISPDGSIQ